MLPGGEMSFIEYFSELDDGRVDINIQYDLLDVVFLTLVSVLSGAEGWKDMQQYGDAKLDWLRQYRPFPLGIPRRHTIARIISALEPDNLVSCFVTWVNAVREKKGQPHIAIDGKTLRGSVDGQGNRLHLLSAMVVECGLVVYQQPCADKQSELVAAQELLELLDIQGACVTLDAMHCQKKTIKKIIDKSADYLVQVKSNQKRLSEEIKAYFHKIHRDQPEQIVAGTYQEVDKGHGRIEERQYVRLDVTDWLDSAADWAGLVSVVEVTRRVDNGKKVRQETAWYITSLRGETQGIADKIRRHWHIENGQHWVLDVVFREDDSRIRTGDAPQNMALFRRFALNLVKLSDDKDSMKGKLKRAAWDDTFRAKLLFGQ
jgi:predicted transposase YbfD/YdcC